VLWSCVPERLWQRMSELVFLFRVHGLGEYRALGRKDSIDWYLRWLRPPFGTTEEDAAAHINLLSLCECTECSPAFSKHAFTANHIIASDYISRNEGVVDERGRPVIEFGKPKGKQVTYHRSDDPNPNRNVISGGSYNKEYERFSWEQSVAYYRRHRSRYNDCNNALKSALAFAARKDLVDGCIRVGKQAISLDLPALIQRDGQWPGANNEGTGSIEIKSLELDREIIRIRIEELSK